MGNKCCGSGGNSRDQPQLPYQYTLQYDQHLAGDTRTSEAQKSQKSWCECCQNPLCKGCCCCCCCLFVAFLLFAAIVALLYANISWSNSFQTYALSNPGNTFVQPLATVLGVSESLGMGRVGQFGMWQQKFGNNFTGAGMVWMGGFDQVRDSLSNPQRRTYHLGEHPLLADHLPDFVRSSGQGRRLAEETRNVFLLALSEDGAGGDGSHYAFRQCFIDTCMQQWQQRMKDDTSNKLFADLEADYTRLSPDEFFNSPLTAGLPKFTVRYLHYLIFGFDPYDEATFEAMHDFFNGQGPITYFFWPLGYLSSAGQSFERVISAYEQSPALANFEVQSKYKDMTKRELASLSAVIMRMAGVQGFQQAFKVVLGAWGLAGFWPSAPAWVDQKAVWDTLDLGNATQLKLYTTECLRLDAPVSVVHRVAVNDIDVVQNKITTTFPAGTKIAVPLAMANVDPAFWGPTSLEFNLYRTGLEENFMGFNSYRTHTSRECPARALVMDSAVEILQRDRKSVV